MPLEAARPTRVDAHLHVWDLARRPQPWTANLPVLQRSYSLADVRKEQEDAEVARVVLVQCVDDVEETRELLGLAAVDERVAGVVGWLDLDAPRFPQDLAELRAGPGGERLVGLRHQLQVEPDKSWLDRTAVRSSLRHLGEATLTFDLVVASEQLEQVARVVAAVPGLRFVLDHCGNPPLRDGELQEWCAHVAAVAAHPNVAVKLSAIATHGAWGATTAADLAPVVDHLLADFGPGRTMFGSDWPVCLLGAGYRHVVTLTEQVIRGLTDADRDAVWSGTAEVWYGLTHAG
jgi:L-fuconolactonase